MKRAPKPVLACSSAEYGQVLDSPLRQDHFTVAMVVA
jgi:hypothetical protein